MADIVRLDCWQCGEPVEWTRIDFATFVLNSPNTRINAADSGSLNLSMFCCDDCNDAD